MPSHQPITPASNNVAESQRPVPRSISPGDREMPADQSPNRGLSFQLLRSGASSDAPAPTRTKAFPKASTRRWHRIGEFSIESLIRLCGISAIIFIFAIFFFVLREAAPVLRKLDIGKFLFTTAWYPTSLGTPRYGVLALIVGTLSVTTLAMVVAVPFGLGAAIFVSEFCSGKVRETLKVVIELLAAIPSGVWGFIGMTVMNAAIQKVFDAEVGVNVLNAGIILALMSVPIIVSIGEDALKAVPDSFRDAGIALGA